MEQERVALFIDGSNFYHGLKQNINRVDIDFGKLANLLCGNRKLVRIYYYNAPVDMRENIQRYKDQQRFFTRLTFIPYLTRKLGHLEKRTKRIKCRAQCKQDFDYEFRTEKGVDVYLAIDMLAAAYKNLYDTAILVAGDGDYAMAIEAVKDVANKHVELAYPTVKCYHLREAADKFILLTRDSLKDCFIAGC
jgi:uncharacterized LabA/DUF88 family protein